MSQISLHTPLGDLTVSEDDGAIVSLDWGWSSMPGKSPLLTKARDQLNRYFDGETISFDLPLNPAGSDFSQKVWREISKIPWGATATYGMIAWNLQTAARAVGGACGRNHIPIIIPCHRVLASGGSLGGYSAQDGLTTKRILLKLENAL